jgi:2',3'-cyclic-nucleotide 2'-phosphodiesterase (5'-nucleotidase family)
VLVSHVGLPQDIEIVKNVPGIDVVLSSHTHNRLSEPVRAAGALLIQSGFSGSFLGRLDLEVTDGRISGVRHRLLPIDPSIAAAPDIDELVHGELRPFRERLAEVVGRTVTPLHRMTVLEATMDNLLTASYRDLTGAEVAFSHGWRYGAPIVPGDVTVGDLWQMVPTDPEVFTTAMTGDEIRARLEESLESVYAGDARRQKGGYVIRTSGLHAIVRLNNPAGTRVEQLDIAGAPMKVDHEYQVAAAGSQSVEPGRTRVDTGVRAVESLRKYFARHSPVSADLTHARFIAV